MPKKTDSGNPRDWLQYVKLDLDAVRLLAENEVSFVVCKSKLAEALEKAMKADLLERGWILEKIHDLQKLNDYLADYDKSAAETLQPTVDELAESYIEGRYPGFDLEEPQWPALRGLLDEITRYVDGLGTFSVAEPRQSTDNVPN